ncbi:hypothetical protein BDY24DRAFT_270876 [Mrakia frigida]|uniref:uncharacterized protein n=1 Tax=Mrakia frigida TaxID=29902 RepID=UPI003FCBFB0F
MRALQLPEQEPLPRIDPPELPSRSNRCSHRPDREERASVVEERRGTREERVRSPRSLLHQACCELEEGPLCSRPSFNFPLPQHHSSSPCQTSLPANHDHLRPSRYSSHSLRFRPSSSSPQPSRSSSRWNSRRRVGYLQDNPRSARNRARYPHTLHRQTPPDGKTMSPPAGIRHSHRPPSFTRKSRSATSDHRYEEGRDVPRRCRPEGFGPSLKDAFFASRR